MKRFRAILIFALIFSAAAQTAYAANYDITEFRGADGLVGHNPAFASGDTLNIKNNISDDQSGHIWNLNNYILTIKGNGHTIKGSDGENSETQGFIMGAGSVFTIEDAVLTNFKQIGPSEVVIRQTEGVLNLTDVDIINNSLDPREDSQTAAVKLFWAADAYIRAVNKDVLFSGNKDGGNNVNRDIYMQDSSLFLLPSSGKTISLMGGISGNGRLQIGNIDALTQGNLGNYAGTLILGGNNEDFGDFTQGNPTDVDVIGATVKLLAGAKYFNPGVNNSYNNGTLDLQNGVIDNIRMDALSIGNLTQMNMNIDVDLENTVGDVIDAGAYTGASGAPVIQDINLLSDTQQKIVEVNVLGGSDFQQAAVLAPSMKVVEGKLYSYDTTLLGNGDLRFTRNGLFSGSALGASFAVQGARLLQEELSYILFENSGNFSFFTKSGESAGDIPRDRPTAWVRAFAIDSEIDFDKYGKADADYYGGIAGIDFDRLYDGFNATYGLFGSYVTGKQKDNGNSIEQSGGYAGARATFYFGKLFLSGILDAGLLNNSAKTAAGTDDFNSYAYCASVKGGYNFELSQRSFTLQPNVIGGFSYIDTEDYTSKSGVKIKSDDMNVFTVMPGVKLAKNLGKCWILSADGHYVYSSVNGDVKANSVLLPEVSYDNYFRYGAGIEKIWGYTVAHLKASYSDGGKSGWNLSAGVEWKF